MAGSRFSFGDLPSRAVLLVGVGVLVTALAVQSTRTGIDVLALLVAILLLLLVERTIGDWLAEGLGPTAATLIFAAVAAAVVLYMLGDTGQRHARRALAAAEARGYHALYFKSPPPPSNELPPTTETSGTQTPADRRRTERERELEEEEAKRREAAAARRPPDAEGTPTGNPVRRPEPPTPRIARVDATPAVATTGSATTLSVRVIPEPTDAITVVFSVNGRVIASEPLNGGSASTAFETDVPGLYTVRVRLTGAGRYSAEEGSTTFNVLPRR
jgi:hypothetical protein